jgi:hypothetical protein
MRSLRCAVILVTALTAGAALAQTQRSISDYRVTSVPSQPGRWVPPPMERIQQTAASPPRAGAPALVPAFLPPPMTPAGPPPVAPPEGVVFQPAPPVPAPVYMPLPPRPTLPTAGGPLDASPPVTAWARAEALLWWAHGKGLPSVFGGEDPINDPRWGGRLTAGAWIDGGAVVGLEASYFRLGGQSAGADVSARPIVNAALVPAGLTGVASATLDATNLSGADAAVRVPVYYDPHNPRPRVDLLVGYRWLHYSERLDLREDLAAAGATVVVRDQFRVRNNFHGAMLGLGYGGRVGAFTLDVTGRASLGHVWRRASIDGDTTVTTPGAAPVGLAGGVLTQGSNIGGHDEGKWTLIPELEMRLGYDVTSALRLTAGYSLLVLNDFARVGNLIDTTGQPPAFNPSAGVIWVHGLNLGAELRF